jgi:hypothetical protein
MGKLTPQMIEAIIKKYGEIKSYSKAAQELGLNWKTVKVHVVAYDRTHGRQAAAQPRLNNQSHVSNSEDSNVAAEEVGHPSDLRQSETEHEKELIHEHSASQQTQHEQQQKKKVKSNFARALHSFQKDLTPVQVAVEIDLPFEEVQKYYAQYGQLRNLHTFFELCQSDADVMNSLVRLHNSMLEENMSPKKYVNVLKYYDPVREIVQKYHDLKVSTELRAQEHREYEQKLKEVQQTIASLQKQAADLQNKRSSAEKQSGMLESQIASKQTTLKELGVRESRIRGQIQAKLSELKQLTSEYGPIQTQIRKQVRKSALEVLNNNEVLFVTAIGAILTLINRDPTEFMRIYHRLPMIQGESMSEYIERCLPNFKAQYASFYNYFREDLSRRVSSSHAIQYSKISDGA